MLPLFLKEVHALMLVFGEGKISPVGCFAYSLGNQTKNFMWLTKAHGPLCQICASDNSRILPTSFGLRKKKSSWNTSKWSLRKSILKNKLFHNGKQQNLWLSGRWSELHCSQRFFPWLEWCKPDPKSAGKVPLAGSSNRQVWAEHF